MEGVQALTHCKTSKGWTWIPAQNLYIYLIDDDQCWQWTQLEDCDRTEVAELLKVRSLDVKGFLDVKTLKPVNKWFNVYLVFKLKDHAHGLNEIKTSVGFVNDPEDDDDDGGDSKCLEKAKSRNGWKEIELGHFYIEKGDQGKVEIKLYDTHEYFKSGLLIKGIEVRQA